MEKHSWHQVHINIQSSVTPVPRWGHSCCVIGDEVIFFGGYAQSIYMNDVWSFNTINMEWSQVKTTGDVPTQRSNCSINYDKQNNRIVVFGGGGPSKRRFNTVNMLDWATKEWLEIAPQGIFFPVTVENQPAPWQRTYHTSELIFPYLVVFGGEGVSDLEDLWVFNFFTLSWKEVRIPKAAPRPCARRFHSSALIGNHFFVIAGCHGKYRCLKDVYSLDLTPLLERENYEELEWKEHKPTGSAFLTRWGHSSAVYDNKIYIFGGRFSNDLNDLLVLDIEKNTLKALKTSADLPRARRRHSACFVGSCMLIFGGFNGDYYNDLYYINAFQLKSKLQIQNCLQHKKDNNFFNMPCFSDCAVCTDEGEKFYLHKGYIFHGFSTVKGMEDFLSQIDGKWSKKYLNKIMSKFYQGYGVIDDDIKRMYGIVLPQTDLERNENLKQLIYGDQKGRSRKNSFNKKQMNGVVEIPDQIFSEFLDRSRQFTYNDIKITVNGAYQMKSNKTVLASASKFFYQAFSGKFSEKDEISLKLVDSVDIAIFQIMLNYLLLQLVIVPEEMSYHYWMKLYEIAEYFVLDKLVKICLHQICNKISEDTCNNIFQFGARYKIEVLCLSCADFIIKCKGSKLDQFQPEAVKLKQKERFILKMYNLSKFDILQIQLEQKLYNKSSKRENKCKLEEKENYQFNYHE